MEIKHFHVVVKLRTCTHNYFAYLGERWKANKYVVCTGHFNQFKNLLKSILFIIFSGQASRDAEGIGQHEIKETKDLKTWKSEQTAKCSQSLSLQRSVRRKK